MVKATFNLILPQFKHDCDRCRFVGIIHGRDCYTCGDSVVMRFGNDGPDYQSLPREVAAEAEPYRAVMVAELNLALSGAFQT